MSDRNAHGGDAERVAARLGLLPAALVDFSVNVNPAGPPAGVLDLLARDAADAHRLARYPDPELASVRTAASSRFNVPVESIVAANGSAALVGAVARALGVSRAVVPVPAFGEYARALGAARCDVVPVALDPSRGFALDAEAVLDAIASTRARLCVLSNPHNPSGSVACAPAIRRLVAKAGALRATVLLDEAFVDYAPRASVVRDAAIVDRLVVLRSVTKFYAIPALRVGFAVARPALAERVREQLDPWPVTSLAADAAATALADDDYARRTRSDNRRERAWLAGALGAVPGLRVAASAANFLLVELGDAWPRSPELRDVLVRAHGVLVRDCSSFDGLADGAYIRVCVRTRADNARLVGALVAVLTSTEPHGDHR